MGAIPTQRETASRAADSSGQSPERDGTQACPQAQAVLPGSPLAPGSARALVRAAFARWTELGLVGQERGADDVMLVASELVTNAVVHAGTDVELTCRLDESGEPVVEVSDRHPSRAPRDHPADPSGETPEYGRGLRLVATLAESWGVTYRAGGKTVWARLPADARPAEGGLGTYESASGTYRGESRGYDGEGGAYDAGTGAHAGGTGTYDAGTGTYDAGTGTYDAGTGAYDSASASLRGLRMAEILAPQPAPLDPEEQRAEHDRGWLGRGALSFLAEASDLLAGQLDENLVAALTGQLIVPRLADWCAIWLEDESTGRGGWAEGAGLGGRLARVWHRNENRVEELHRALEKDPPRAREGLRSGPEPYPWPGDALEVHGARADGDSGGTALAYRLIAGGRPLGTLVIGRCAIAGFPDEITGLVEDLGRRVALAIGAARQYARQATISAVLQRGLLPGAVAEIPGLRSALVYEPCDKGGPSGDFYDLFPAGDGRWCFAIGDVQGKGPEAAVVIGLARPWLRLLAREGYRVADVLDRLNQLLLDDATEAADAAARALVAAGGRQPPGDGPQTRFLSLLYGELVPYDGGVRCTLASAGHPLPLLLGPDGEVRTAAQPQTLLGVVEDATYTSETVDLVSGESLLCVTDGVTERRSGSRQFDDGDGLAQALAGCAGLNAELIAERIRRLVHDFGGQPPEDDLALLVLQAE